MHVFLKLAVQSDVGGSEGCLSGSLRELYVFGRAAEAQTESEGSTPCHMPTA